VRRRIERPYAEPPELRRFEFAIADAGDDSFLGALMIHSCDWRHRRAEVGFWVAPWARGRGVLSAALTLFIDWAFGELALERIEMTALPDNDIVPRVAARFGFVREGLLRKRNYERGARVDLVLWGLLREEREAARAHRAAPRRVRGTRVNLGRTPFPAPLGAQPIALSARATVSARDESVTIRPQPRARERYDQKASNAEPSNGTAVTSTRRPSRTTQKSAWSMSIARPSRSPRAR
jgi:RimJ/RimL family protein N-acetyltransferase